MGSENFSMAEWLGIAGFIISSLAIIVTAYIALRKTPGELLKDKSETAKNEAERNLTKIQTTERLDQVFKRIGELNDELVEERKQREQLQEQLDAEREARILDRQLFEHEIQAERALRQAVEQELQAIKSWAEKLLNQVVGAGLVPFPYANEPDQAGS